MPMRRKLNLSLAGIGVLVLATAGYLGLAQRQDGAEVAQLEATARQQVLVGSLVTWADSLAAGTSREQVVAARTALGRSIAEFDQGLGALLAGGQVTLDGGRTRRVTRVSDATARHALELASHVWLETGMPLGDLAAGQYSAYSAAGQQALAGLAHNHSELTLHLQAAADGIRLAARQRAQAAGYAAWAGGVLGLAWLALLAVRLWPARRHVAAKAGAAEARPLTPASHRAPDYADGARRHPARSDRTAPYAPTIDFENVSAAVDQLSVDMNNIAGNSEKMRQAIESVGFALQGMLYSLNEMAQDTAEGHKIVRNANNAASFTAEAAGELVDSAREMSRIVERVTQLALRTRQVAGQIDGEAVQTGRTGEAFTSVVAQEVRGLAQQTHRATSEIDHTVGEVLATARQYEEAIGQIIKNVAAINKVSQNLGQLMLDPPRRVQPVAAAAAAISAAPAVSAPAAPPTPVAPPAPVADIEDDPVTPEPTPREVAETTSAAISAAARQAPKAEPAPAPVAEAPAAAAPAAAPPAPAAAAPEVAKPDGSSNGNVFMLGKPRRKPTMAEVLGTESAPVESAATAPAAAAPPAPAAPAPTAAAPVVPAPVVPTPVVPTPVAAAPEPLVPANPALGHNQPTADGGSNGNVFLLNKARGAKPAAPAAAPAPAAAAEPVAAAPAPTPAPAAPAAPAAAAAAEDGVEAGGSNIFMLNRPKKTAPAGDGAATAVAEPEAAPAAPAAPPPAAEGEAPKKNFMMLNSPKKPK